MKLIDNIVFNPDVYLLPHYKISPFRTEHAFANRKIAEKHCPALDFFLEDDYDSIVTVNARKAIALALESLGLQPDDVVTILTTSGNFYISSCVTRTIEQYCQWDREMQPKTKVLLVNHEFGFPYENLSQLKEYRLPIIEDCAHAFFSQNKENSVGRVGDFVVYSLPKIMPMQLGGILRVRKSANHKAITYREPEPVRNYITACFNHYLQDRDAIICRRIENYGYLSTIFSACGLTPRFALEANQVPGVFIFNIDNVDINGENIKHLYWNNGIESSVFYKENAVFIPVHQYLTKDDMDFFLRVYQSFLIRE
ncbi:MAG: DegT/DnrJ/EryC1/StrS family aminotransferase [Dysgonamonadaceae bacterium]|nr:DegT/DnrJ/EryC1/StrS family aminotransferase [Dysgonamonadaceae bacterium]